MQAEFLDSPELRKLTGAAWSRGQAAWLREHGIPFRQDGLAAKVRRKINERTEETH